MGKAHGRGERGVRPSTQKMSTPEQRQEVDKNFRSLDVFAWCFQCATMLLGADKRDSFWGRRTTLIGQLHRKVTSHDVYIKHKETK